MDFSPPLSEIEPPLDLSFLEGVDFDQLNFQPLSSVSSMVLEDDAETGSVRNCLVTDFHLIM